MQLSPLDWQSLSLSYSFEAETECGFFDFQPNAKQAFLQLNRNRFGSALVLKSELFPEFFAEIQAYFHTHHTHTVALTEFDRKRLFGYRFYHEKSKNVEHLAGAIEQADGGVLILNIHHLLLDISQWDKLKQALLFGEYQPHSCEKLPAAVAPICCRFKLILIGGREDIATLFEYDDSLYQFCQYSEIDSYLTLAENQLNQWGSYVQSCAKRALRKSFSVRGLNQLLHHYVRESEDQAVISISPTRLNKYLFDLAQFYPEMPQLDDIQGYFEYLSNQAAVLNRLALQDILAHQLYIDTEGEVIGQINGLSVVEFHGIPVAFGEPLRISCNVQYGEGEIQDIERKVELGGNIHSKGIILAQSCLSNLLEFPTQLPFSASLAFEQSYGEVDGDSSSLAIFCVLMSALTQLPLPQSIAVTGAIDQFGNVLSVGGVNQKIEGFFDVCQARGLTGKQGVIIPAVCQSHLSLKPAVIDAVKAQQFSVWVVSDVFDALQILLNHAFFDDDLPHNSSQSSLFALVHQRLESQHGASTRGGVWQRFCKIWRH